jgi:Uma2 family endonuclease
MSIAPLSFPNEPEYAWEVATLFPEQGAWSEEQYLDLTDHNHRRIEFTDGRLELLPTPTEIHQELVAFLYATLLAFVKTRGLGKAHFSGIRRPDKIREPDVIFLHKDTSTPATTAFGTVQTS